MGGGGGGFFWGILVSRGDSFFVRIISADIFRKSYITFIITVVGAQQQHKGMFLKHGREGRKFSNRVMGRSDFFPMYSRGGGVAPFFMFSSSTTWDRSTMHPKFDLTGVRTHDLQIITVHFM